MDDKLTDPEKGLLQNDYLDSPIREKLHEKRKHMLENMRKRLGLPDVDSIGRPLTEDGNDG